MSVFFELEWGIGVRGKAAAILDEVKERRRKTPKTERNEPHSSRAVSAHERVASLQTWGWSENSSRFRDHVAIAVRGWSALYTSANKQRE
jgi:hypothetical protein